MAPVFMVLDNDKNNSLIYYAVINNDKLPKVQIK